MICAAHQTSCEVDEMREAIGVYGVQERLWLVEITEERTTCKT
jgi:hypothetical protein